MVERSQDWLNQARRDMKQAESSLGSELYEWACFASQQGADKAVKALIQSLGGEAWGHSVTSLIDSLPENVRPVHLRDKALELDQAYIPSRYPNAHPIGFPGNLYSKNMAERLIGYAREIIEHCQNEISKGERRTR